ncbi:MAG: hypothetical protein IJK81_12280 [Selenomonadaceae bacterium]|nr:hypothetical protein [Selenomonadaceae bacterium]
MKIITHDEIKGVITPTEAFDLVKKNFVRKSEWILPPKTSLKYKTSDFFNIMPCMMPEEGFAGVKMIFRRAGRIPTLTSKIIIFDYNTGDALALIAGDYLTVLRTGAVAALAAETFALKNYSRIGLWGLGNTAYATFDVLMERRKIFRNSPIEVYLLRYKNQAEKFIERFRHRENVQFFIVDSYEAVVENSQVLFSCVSNMDDLFCDAKKYPQGITIIPVHSKGFQNCDLIFDKIFADQTEQIKTFKYWSQISQLNYYGELTDVLTGKIEGRTNEHERILSYNVGIAIHDIRFAFEIYKRIGDNCAEFNLKSPTDKFFY